MSGDDWDREYFEVNEEIDVQQYLDTSKVVFVSLGSSKGGQFKVKAEKAGKFQKFISKLLSEYGTLQPDSLFLPTGPNADKKGEEWTLGYAFAEFCSEGDAEKCVKAIRGIVKKGITFKAFHYADFEHYKDIPDEWEKPSMDDFGNAENRHAWLLDDDTRDQFAVRYGDDTEIYWHDPLRRGQRELKYGGERQKSEGKVWTELFVQWSTQGTYLTTFHDPGVVLWGGSDFTKVTRATHYGMEYLDFSPRENFFVTMRPTDATRKDEPKAIRVWWTTKSAGETAELVREFDGGYSLQNHSQKGEQPWPIYKWAYNDRYFARINYKESLGTIIEIVDGYGAERPGTKKKNFRVENLLNFEWSPAAPYMAYTSSEIDNTPATIAIVDMKNDSRKKLALKRLYRVYHPCIINFSDKAKDRYDFSTSMKWHPDGRYFACLVPRWGGKAKNKKLQCTNFEIFRVGSSRGGEIPVEVLELENQVVYNFEWEGSGDRFAIIHSKFEVDARGEYVAKERQVSFYSLLSAKGKPELRLITTLGRQNGNTRRVTQLFWSPKGRHIVLLGTGNRNNGALEFFDVDRKRTLAGGPDAYNRCEHPSCNGGAWDPSGRYFATYVSCGLGEGEGNAATQDYGYQLWTFQGDSASEYKMPLHQFYWRPRPKSLLTEETVQEIRKNLRTGTQWDDFESRDDQLRKAGWSKDMAERHRVLNDWREYRDRAKLRAEEIKQERNVICGYDEEDHGDFRIEEVEEEQVLNYREYRWKDKANMRWQPDAPPPDGPEYWDDTTDQEKAPMEAIAE